MVSPSINKELGVLFFLIFFGIDNIRNALPDSSITFFIFFKVFLVMTFSADPQKINNFISVGFVGLMFSHFYFIILCLYPQTLDVLCFHGS